MQLVWTCAVEGWNTVQYSFVMQLVQMRGGTQYSIICHVTCADEGWNTVQYHLSCNLCRWGVEHSTISFVMQLAQMRGGTQYAAWRCGQTHADVGGTQYNSQFSYWSLIVCVCRCPVMDSSLCKSLVNPCSPHGIHVGKAHDSSL